MISLFKLHFHYLFSWKTLYITFGLILVSIVSFLLFSNCYLNHDLLNFDKEYYLEEYYFESLSYLKFTIIIYNLFLVLNGFVFNHYDLFLLVRKRKKIVIITKIVTLLLGNFVLVSIFYLLFLIIGLFLTPYMKVSLNDVAIFLDLVIFGSVYLLIYLVVYSYSKSIYSFLLVIIGFFISDLSSDYKILKSSASFVNKGINLLFISINNYQETGYSLYYDKIYGIILFSCLFIVIYRKYLITDF